jgi:Tol biopolymer transport system component
LEAPPRTKLDLMMLPVDGDDVSGWKPGEPTVILNGDSNEWNPMVSPDGRWLAYVSDESGRDEVYVRPFGRPGGRTPISTEGGRSPVWSPTSGEILYGTASRGQGQVMIAAYTIEGGALVVDKARVWAGASYQFRGPNRMFDLHPDGTRIALGPVIQPDDRFSREYVTFVFNFFTELRRGANQQSP